MTHRIYRMRMGDLYPAYVAKVERKGRTRAELEEVVRWLTGHTGDSLAQVLEGETDVEGFFAQAPALHPDRTLVTGVVCGVRVEEVPEETMREVRRLDKLVDELARGKPVSAVLRS